MRWALAVPLKWERRYNLRLSIYTVQHLIRACIDAGK